MSIPESSEVPRGLARVIDELFRELEAAGAPRPAMASDLQPEAQASPPPSRGAEPTSTGSTAPRPEPEEPEPLPQPGEPEPLPPPRPGEPEPLPRPGGPPPPPPPRPEKPEPLPQPGEPEPPLPPQPEAATAEAVPHPASAEPPPRVVYRPESDDTEAWVVELARTVSRFLEGGGPSRQTMGARIAELVQALENSGDRDVVCAAIERLAADGRPSDPGPVALARALLTPALAGGIAARLGAAARDEPVRERLILVVARLGESMAPVLAEVLTEAERGARRALLDALVGLGDAALGVAERMAADDRWFVVRNAMVILREIAGERAMDHFTAALAHEDARVRREALLSLAHVGGESASLLVPSKIADVDPEVRLAAAVASGALKVERAVKPLLEQLERDEDQEVQIAILGALGQIADPGAVLAIEKRVEGGFFSRKAPSAVRAAAYRALWAIGTPHARTLVNDAANDRDQEVRDAVARLPAKGA